MRRKGTSRNSKNVENLPAVSHGGPAVRSIPLCGNEVTTRHLATALVCDPEPAKRQQTIPVLRAAAGPLPSLPDLERQLGPFFLQHEEIMCIHGDRGRAGKGQRYCVPLNRAT